jgi:hypothetical protein
MVLDKVNLLTRALHGSNGRTQKNSRQFQPSILSHLSVNLWGQDMLKDMGVLVLRPNEQVTQMMLPQG